MKNLVLLMAFLIPGVALAQEAYDPDAHEKFFVFVEDDHGNLRTVIPTPQFALESIQAQKRWGGSAAEMILGQVDEQRFVSAAELDAFADDLGRLILETPSSKVARKVKFLLQTAAYERAAEVLINVYEAMDGTEAVPKRDVLYSILDAGVGGAGEAYVRNLFASSEPPEKPCWLPPVWIMPGEEQEPEPPKEEHCPYKTQWCEVGTLLIQRERIALATGYAEYSPFKAGVDPDLVFPLCDQSMEKDSNGDWGLYPVRH